MSNEDLEKNVELARQLRDYLAQSEKSLENIKKLRESTKVDEDEMRDTKDHLKTLRAINDCRN